MLLAVDMGNTNVVFAVFEDPQRGVLPGRALARWRIATDPRRTADEYAVWLAQLLAIEGMDRGAITGMIVSTVVPRARHNLEVLGRKYFGLEPLIAGEGGAAWTFPIDVDEPRSLGADRAVNALAAHAKYLGDLIVVDFGTATTFDVVDFTGAYKGGIIAPGINLSLEALFSNTAKLPRIAISAPRTASAIGRNTEDQMLIGAFWGYVAMIEGLLARQKAEIGRPTKVVATGGLAVLFDQQADLFDVVDTDLTLDGLVILAAGASS